VLEPDQDGDGYGDETQDGCSTSAATQGPCDTTAPRSDIRSGPGRSGWTTVRFRFRSDDASATFECRLKGRHARPHVKQWRPCTSPVSYRRLEPGTYTFLVRGTDPLGNRERSPARRRFHVAAPHRVAALSG
jgi:hypothetical protein